MFRIVNWNDHFERADTRKCKAMAWVPLSTNHGSLMYRKLMRADPLLYLAWVLIVQTAARCNPRGTLVDDRGKPLTADDLAIRTDASAQLFEKAFPQLCAVGWLEEISGCHPDNIPTASGCHPEVQDRTGQNRTGQERTGEAQAPQPPPTPGLWGSKGCIKYDPQSKSFVGISEEHKTRWREAYPLVNLDSFLPMMASKVWANRTGWGRKSDYERALENWLGKEQDSGSRGRRPAINADINSPDFDPFAGKQPPPIPQGALWSETKVR